MNVGIDAAGGQYLPLSSKYLRRGADFHPSGYAIHDAWIPCLADCRDPTVANGDISFVYSGVIENQGVGNYQIGSACGPRGLRRLAHAVAGDFAAAELHFVTVGSPVAFDFDDKARVGQTDTISGGWAVMIRVCVSVDPHLLNNVSDKN